MFKGLGIQEPKDGTSEKIHINLQFTGGKHEGKGATLWIPRKWNVEKEEEIPDQDLVLATGEKVTIASVWIPELERVARELVKHWK